MKLILWAAAEEVAFKAEAEVITAEQADVATEEDLMVDVDEEDYMEEEAGKTQDINSPYPMPECYSLTMARRQRFILPMTSHSHTRYRSCVVRWEER